MWSSSPLCQPLILGGEGTGSECQASVPRASTTPHVVMVWVLVEGAKHGACSPWAVPRDLRRVGMVQWGTGVHMNDEYMALHGTCSWGG